MIKTKRKISPELHDKIANWITGMELAIRKINTLKPVEQHPTKSKMIKASELNLKDAFTWKGQRYIVKGIGMINGFLEIDTEEGRTIIIPSAARVQKLAFLQNL